MSNSFRKTPIVGITTAYSEKRDKRLANRRLRRRARVALRLGEEVPVLRQVSDVWLFAKDGKQYLRDRDKYWREMRK